MSKMFKQPGDNIIMSTDSYKQTHWRMYPLNMTHMVSYLEARVGGEYDSTVFFGLQYILDRYFSGEVVTLYKLEEAREIAKLHFGRDDLINVEGWTHIINDHDGRLPVKIRSVSEGMIVPEGNVLLTIENTCPKCAWVVNYLETILVQVWYPCTVATISHNQKRVLKYGLERSADTLDKLSFMLHDFGYSGSTSIESAAIGGAAHLINFVGTDTIAGIELLKTYYPDPDNKGLMPGFSIPAAEHSTICAWGKNNEVDAYRHILQTFNEGLVAVVSDSYDVFNACKSIWGGELYNYVWTGKNTGRTLVVRPDSGDPEKVVSKCLNLLGEKFGHTVNSKGYRVLPDYLRLIQGDGISRESLPGLIESILRSGWSLENMAFGSGGGLLQDCNRDTLRFAMKCSGVKFEGDLAWRGVSKSPVSDPSKASKSGYLYIDSEYGYATTSIPVVNDVLRTVFKNGVLSYLEDITSIRQRVEVSLNV